MNEAFKEEIDKLLEKNNLELDLSNLQQELDEICLDYVLDRVKQIPNLGKIIWSSEFDFNSYDQLKNKKEQIESQLIENNENYSSFPSDFIHCLMAYHVYTDTKMKPTSLDAKRELAWSKLNENGWGILETFEEKEYKSILYVNEKKKQLVLSFQGIRLKLSDFFTVETKKIESFVYLLLQNKDISHQTIYSYLHTKRAVDLCNEKGYILSLTGYSFGAWLAEQCLFFCHKDFNRRDVRAVTFESPGSLNFLDKLKTSSLLSDELKFDLDDLDIKTYLNEPNFINTCNKHLGKVYRLYTDNRQSFTSQFIYEQIDQIEEERIKKKLMRSFEQKIKPSTDKNAFFLKGIKSLLPDGLELMLASFSFENFKLKKVINWPRAEFISSKEFQEAFKNLFDPDQVLQLIPFIQSVPDTIKTISAHFTNLTLKQNCEIVSDHLNSLSIVFSLVTEMVSGNFNNEKFLEHFFQSENLINEIPGERENLFNKNNFVVNFDSQYKLQEVNLNKEALINHLYGSVDYYLEKFTKINEFSSLNDEFIIKQLDKLRSEFVVETDNNKTFIKSHNVTIERIRERFERLILLEDKLKSFFENYFSQDLRMIESGKLTNYFKESKLKYFTSREKELRFIRDKFQTKQYICIYGKAGCGKSSLARQYAYERSEKDKRLTVRWIDASCEQNILIDLKRIAHELNIHNKDQGIISLVKNKLNNQSKNDKFLFILDNVTNEEDLTELTCGFSKNCEFILTTRNELIEINDDFNYEKLFIKNFNRDEAMIFINKTLRVKITDQISESDWKDILDLIESSKNVTISPLKLSKLISVVNEHSSWTSNEIKAHINKEKDNKFYLMKSECMKAYTILVFLAYLDGSSISLELIRSIFLEDNTNEIVDAVNYLVKYSLLTPNDTGFKLHELTQAEIVTSAKYSEAPISRSYILNRIVLALNNLFINKNIDDAKTSMTKKTELLAKQVFKILTIEWETKFKNENTSDLFKKMAKLSKEIVYDYKASLNFYLDELKCKKELHPPNHSAIALSLNNIAVAYYCLDDYAKALEYYNETYKIYKESSNYNAVNIANCLHNLAVVYRHLEQHKLALDTYEESLKLKRENLPPNHTSIAMTLNNIALVYENIESFDKSLTNYTECLKIFKETLPSNHSSIASILTSISNVYRKMGEYDTALEKQLEALEIKKLEEPPNTASLAMTYNNVGLIYCYLENFEKSLEMYNECLRLFIETLPANYSSIASTINNIANVYSDAGEYKKALENYKESLRIKRETLPSNHSSIATTLNNIGLIYEHLGDLDKALENYKECLIIFVETLPANHTSIVSTIMSIGNVHFKQGEYTKALENYLECLSIKKQTIPIESISFGNTLNSIGFVYDKLSDYNKALEYFTQSLNIYEKILPENHATLAAAIKNIENTKRKIS